MEQYFVKLKKLGGIVVSKEEKEKMTFEKALGELEAVVEKLESGDLPLEEAIKYYEKGMKLSKTCDSILKNVSEKMTHILNEDGDREPFDLQEE